MKKIFAILTIFFICAIGKTATDSNNIIVPDSNITAVQDTNTTANCRERIKQLEMAVESQQKRIEKLTAVYNDIKKQLDEQIKENERMKALLPKDKINSVVPAAGFDPNSGIVYRGIKRDKLWFYRMYAKFYDKIAYVGGKYYDIQERLPNQKTISTISKDSFIMGTVVTTPPNCQVYKVLGNGEMLIIRPGSEDSTTVYQPALSYGQRSASSETYINSIPELVFYVKGITDNITADKPFSMSNLIAAGSYTYENRKIQSFIVYKPLTKEQFAEAINSGFELVSRKSVNGKVIETPMR